ncbi:copper-binding protein [Phenylobacterium koreense]|uniref:Cu(I)/Ag(I) efflux system protein CusF n=1 Tax=Phenylobacterium koreense TaxID=266125 RepID=A0ABV2ELF6_9CAUL
MKTPTLCLIAVALMATPAAAQHAGHGDHAAAPAPAAVASAEGTGVVKKVDTGAGTVTIDHDPIRALNWPAMTMAFKVPDKAVLDQMKEGAKVRFLLSGGQTIVAVRPQ